MSARLLICTDLDRTLLPNGRAPESPGVRDRFARVAADPRIGLVYVTGRDARLVDEAIGAFALPLPDHLIADVGATVADRRQDAWRRRSDWDDHIAADWCGLSGDELHGLLRDIPGLRRQAASRQGRFKLSYEIDLPADAVALQTAAGDRLRSAGVAANLIWSVDDQADLGLLDVLPAGADKALAILWLADQLGYRHDEILFAGDSGNDLPVLAGPIPAVLVANAADDVRRQAVAAAEGGGWRDRLYLAAGGWAGLNGNYAAGILEGVAHYHPGLKDLLEAES